MSRPQVSVIIPAHNSEKFVERALQSIRENIDIEVIVALDTCTDNTKGVIENFKDYKLRCIEGKWKDPALARRQAIDVCEAPYICFLDADDEFLPGKIEYQLGFTKKSPFNWTCTSYQVSKPGSKPYRVQPRLRIGYNDLLGDCDIGNSTVMVAKKILPQEFPVRPKEDFALWLQLAGEGAYCEGLDILGTIHHRHPEQDTANRFRSLLERNKVLTNRGLGPHRLIMANVKFALSQIWRRL